ncbi:MAG: DUF1836 domain-containing protein [Lachnospiraceae bacterium]|jgi:DNA-binding transcriptional MerR regulator|nr:DUF1836 domain-containing protein [Lachnospiraceae bacterium]
MTNKEFLTSMITMIKNLDYIKPDAIPNIDLYMDQVTTFMDANLEHSKRYEEDKILTKTMINNYAKNNLLPPPVKKKYSKEHILLLIFIYYLKSILSISDIQTLLKPLTDMYFSKEEGLTLEEIYQEVFSLEKEQVISLEKDVMKKFERSKELFSEIEEENREFLQTFSFICMLSFDVYMKKQMIEKMLDEWKPENDKKKKR